MSDAGPGAVAVLWFVVVIAVTLAITLWAARRTRSRQDFYVAGGSISGTKNGLAIAGDFLSASTIVGVPAMVYAGGAEVIVYVSSNAIGFVLTLLFIVEPLRRLGRYTVAEVVAHRFEGRSVRAMTALISIAISLFYLIAQLVAGGALIQILFGIDYAYGVSIVATLMVVYVTVGGMVVATWVQIVKAVVLVAGIILLTFVTLQHADFDLPRLYAVAGANLAAAGTQATTVTSPFAVFSVGLAFAFGIPGLPHLLMRILTVPDVRQARRSMVVAMYVNVFVVTLVLVVLSYGVLAFVRGEPALLDESGGLAGGANMAIIHLARLVGGEAMFGFVAAVLFATILAVVSGLTLAAAGALSHDLYAQTLRRGQTSERAELRVFRLGTLVVTAVAVLLAIVFRGQNVTFLVGLAFAVAASANFPVLFLSIYWRGLTRYGALASGITGLVSSVALIIASPTIWVDVLGHATPLFPAAYPTLIAMPLALAVACVVSVLEPRYSPRFAE